MASTDTTVARTLHDLGLAAWFGGSLMGAAGLNGAATAVQDPTQRLRVANTGWARWTPLNLAGIAAHLAGQPALVGPGQDRPDRGRAWQHRLCPRAGQEAGAGRRRPGGGRHHPEPGDT